MTKKELNSMLKSIEMRNVIEDGRLISKSKNVFDIDGFEYQEEYNNFAFHISRKIEKRNEEKVISLTKYFDINEMLSFTQAKSLQDMLETMNSYKFLHLEQTFDGESYQDISIYFE